MVSAPIVVSEHVNVLPIFNAGKLEYPIIPLSVDEFDIKGTFPLCEIISLLVRR